MPDQIERIAGALREAESVTALTGAGISTESGIPDFRGPQGVWTRNPEAEKLFTLQNYMADAEVRKLSWRSRVDGPAWAAQPNAGHEALVELERKGKLQTLVTQNIDGLHRLAGTSPEVLIEIHGTMREVVCMECGRRSPAGPTLDRVRAGDEDPACLDCGGILKTATISFGQNLVAEDMLRAETAAAASDVFLALGTSLTVYPVAGLVDIALRAGAALVVVNAQQTPFDLAADAVLREPLGEVLRQIAAAV